MNLSKVIGAVLVIVGLAVGYVGFNKIADNTKEIKFLGLKIDASNESKKEQGYIYLGLAAVFLAGGFYTVNKAK